MEMAMMVTHQNLGKMRASFGPQSSRQHPADNQIHDQVDGQLSL